MVGVKSKKAFVAILLLCALIAGLVFDLTKILEFIKVRQSGASYNGFSFETPDSLILLGPGFRDILDGRWTGFEGALYEYMNAPAIWTSHYNGWLLAPLIFFLGGVNYLFVVGFFIIGALLFFLFFTMINLLVKNRVYGVVCSFVFVAAANIFYLVFPISMKNIKISIKSFSFLGDYPIEILTNRYNSMSVLPGLVPFSLFFIFTYLVITRRSFVWPILSGIVGGMLVYLFPSSAMYAWASMGVMLATSLLIRQYAVARRVFWSLMAAVVVSSVYFFDFFALKLLPWSDEMFLRIGGEFGHSFRLGGQLFEYALYIILAIVIWKLAKKRNNLETAIFLTAFCISPILLLNIQAITGFSPFPNNWYYHQFYYGFALCWLTVLYWIYEIIKDKYPKKTPYLIFIGGFLALAIFARAIQTDVYRANMEYAGHSMPKNVAESFKWLNDNTEKNSVVASPSYETSSLLAAFTHNNIMLPSGENFPGPQYELSDRLMIVYKLFNLPTEAFRENLDRDHGMIFAEYFSDHRVGAYLADRPVDESSNILRRKTLEGLVSDYAIYPDNLKFLINKYRIDYFYIGHYEQEPLKIDHKKFDILKWLDKVYDMDGVKIYKVRKAFVQ